jgi:hypothetical protein
VPKPPKPVSDIDQRKAGLQGDHDPCDPVQLQNDKPKGDFTPPKQKGGPYDRDGKQGDDPRTLPG